MSPTLIRWARFLAASTGLLIATWVVWAAPAQAHASLVSTDPTDGSVVESAPERITLTFTEPVRLTDAIALLDASGNPVQATVAATDAVVTITPEEEMPDGTYIVGWRVISADSHPIAGGFSFSVGAPSVTSVALPTIDAPRDVDLVRKSAEAIRYGGVLVATGLAFFAFRVAPAAMRRSPRQRQQIAVISTVSALLAVIAAVLLVPLTQLWQGAAPLSDIAAAAVERSAWSSSTGAATAVLVTVAAIGLASMRRAPALAWTAAVVATGSLVLVGHTRTYGPAWLILAADLAHVLVAAIWLGGLVGLLVLLGAGSRVRPADLRAAVLTFSRTALISVGILAVSGLLLWWRIPATVTDLPDSSYGRHLIVKVLLVGIVVGLGAWNLRHLRSSRRLDPSRLRTIVRAEATLLAVVVAVTAGMITQTPRDTSAASATAVQSLSRELTLGDTLTAKLTLTPGRVGTNAVSVIVTDADGQPIEAIEPPAVSVAIEEFELGPFTHQLTAISPGRYEANIDLPIEGRWTLRLAIRTSTFERPAGATTVEVS